MSSKRCRVEQRRVGLEINFTGLKPRHNSALSQKQNMQSNMSVTVLHEA